MTCVVVGRSVVVVVVSGAVVSTGPVIVVAGSLRSLVVLVLTGFGVVDGLVVCTAWVVFFFLDFLVGAGVVPVLFFESVLFLSRFLRRSRRFSRFEFDFSTLPW